MIKDTPEEIQKKLEHGPEIMQGYVDEVMGFKMTKEMKAVQRMFEKWMQSGYDTREESLFSEVQLNYIRKYAVGFYAGVMAERNREDDPDKLVPVPVIKSIPVTFNKPTPLKFEEIDCPKCDEGLINNGGYYCDCTNCNGTGKVKCKGINQEMLEVLKVINNFGFVTLALSKLNPTIEKLIARAEQEDNG